jgi:uncharacterized membrane protein
MFLMKTAHKLIHGTFRAGITLKGVDSLLEAIVGILLVVNPAALHNLSVRLWTYGAFRSAHPFLASHLAEQLQKTDPAFAAAYLISHGLVKVVLVIALWMEKLWAYPLAILVFAAFVFYQMFRFTHTHSIGLILLTIFDIAIIYLTWLEYRDQKRLRATKA